MSQVKKYYYINIGSGEISQSSTDSTWNYKIEATDDEIKELRELFNQNYSTEWQSFWRAHIPFKEYHHDKENDAYDETVEKVYQMIYELGDQEAKEHIETMGIFKS